MLWHWVWDVLRLRCLIPSDRITHTHTRWADWLWDLFADKTVVFKLETLNPSCLPCDSQGSFDLPSFLNQEFFIHYLNSVKPPLSFCRSTCQDCRMMVSFRLNCFRRAVFKKAVCISSLVILHFTRQLRCLSSHCSFACIDRKCIVLVSYEKLHIQYWWRMKVSTRNFHQL